MDVTGAYFSAYVAGKYSCLLKRSGRAFSSAICYSSDSLGAGGVAVAGDDLEAATWQAKDLDDAVSSKVLNRRLRCLAAELPLRRLAGYSRL